MSDYSFNSAQKAKAMQLIEAVNNGLRPVVLINDEIFDDCYLESGMIATLEKCIPEEDDLIVEGNQDLCYKFVLNFKDFEEQNLGLESANYRNTETGEYDLTGTEAGCKPGNLKETVFHSITHGKLFFSVCEGDTLFNEFISSKSNESYINWLETMVISLRK
jgi:hypothetical protein